jgi:hypothetical protein
MEIRSYRECDFAGVDQLWREAFPEDPPRNRAASAIPAKLAVQPDMTAIAAGFMRSPLENSLAVAGLAQRS